MFLKSLFFISLFLLATSAVSSSVGQLESVEKPNIVLSVKVISLEGCQATPPTIEVIKETARELHLQINLEHVIVKTPEEAEKNRHIGSPTVQVNDLDIDPEARAITQFGIT